MTAVVFETPGLIDVRAFTIIGAHAKPNSANPIGYFGTGLKLAMAILVRMGAEPVVWIGRDRFSFHKKAATFRGSPLETIVMRVLKAGNKRAVAYELPYTTGYGKNWKPWQAFRELESNTRDEHGTTYLFMPSTDYPSVKMQGADGLTRIVVEHPDFLDAAEKIDSIFLPRAKREGKLLEALPASDGEDESFVYYRTMRAWDAGKPTLFTYNILENMTLTEDRTFMYGFQARDVVARWVLSEATEAQVEAVLTAGEEWWEHGLEFPARVPPSPSFHAVMTRRPKGLSRDAHSYYGGYSGGRASVSRPGFSLFSECPKPWKLSGDSVVDANGDEVFVRPDDMGAEEWDAVAGAIIKRLDVLPIPGRAPTIEGIAFAAEPQAIPTDEGMPF